MPIASVIFKTITRGLLVIGTTPPRSIIIHMMLPRPVTCVPRGMELPCKLGSRQITIWLLVIPLLTSLGPGAHSSREADPALGWFVFRKQPRHWACRLSANQGFLEVNN